MLSGFILGARGIYPLLEMVYSLECSIYMQDDRKNFQFQKRGIGIKSEKYANNLEFKKSMETS